MLNSLVANYLVRLNVTTHVTASLMSRLPVPKPAESRHSIDSSSLARALAATGVDANSDDYAELNAIAAGLYGVTPEQYASIVDCFPLLSQVAPGACPLTSGYGADVTTFTETRKHRSTESNMDFPPSR